MEAEQILKKLSQNLGFNESGDSSGSFKASPGELLDFIKMKFSKLLGFLKEEEGKRQELEKEVELLHGMLVDEKEKKMIARGKKNGSMVKNNSSISNRSRDISLSRESQKTNDELWDQYEGLRKKLKESNDEKQMLNLQVEKITSEKKRIETLLHETEEEIKALRVHKKESTDMIKHYEKYYTLKENEGKNANEQLRDALKKNREVITTNEKIEKENQKSKNELQTANQRLKALRAENKKLEQKTEEIMKQCEYFIGIEDKYKEIKDQNHELKHLLQLSQASYDNVEKHNTSIIEKNKSMSSKIEELEHTIEELNMKLTDAKKNGYLDMQPMAKFEDQLGALQRDLEHYQRIMTNLQSRLKDVEKENLELLKRNGHLEEELYREKSKILNLGDSPFESSSKNLQMPKSIASPSEGTGSLSYQHLSRTYSPQKKVSFMSSPKSCLKNPITNNKPAEEHGRIYFGTSEARSKTVDVRRVPKDIMDDYCKSEALLTRSL